MTTLEVVERFIACINEHDVRGLTALMTPSHRFIDSLGNVVTGRDAMQDGWRQYFLMVPDYRIEVTRSFADGAEAVLIGVARGTYTRDGQLHADDAWETPAAWYVKVRNDQVAQWQVYADNEPIRKRMAKRPS